MKRILSVAVLLLLGSCALPSVKTDSHDNTTNISVRKTTVADIFNECDTLALKAYPVVKKAFMRGRPTPTVICKLTDSLQCNELQIQLMSELDVNDLLRKAYDVECIKLKLNNLTSAQY